MGRLIFVSAPGGPQGLENQIMRHIATNTGEVYEWIDGPVPKGEKTGTGFYDVDVWHEHQLHVMQDLLFRKTQEGDHIIFTDAWFPGLEMVRMAHPDAYLVGFVHGCSSIPGDLMGWYTWANGLESAWFEEMYDSLLVQTPYTFRYARTWMTKAVLVGSPFDPAPFVNTEEKVIDVIWPHRCSPDKGFDDFLAVARILAKDYRIVVTTAGELSSGAYEQLMSVGVTAYSGCTGTFYKSRLAEAKVVLSTAQQETWGYAVMEAVASGAIPLVPGRACYPYLYHPDYQYADGATPEQIARSVKDLLDNPLPAPIIPKIEIKRSFVDGRFVLR